MTEKEQMVIIVAVLQLIVSNGSRVAIGAINNDGYQINGVVRFLTGISGSNAWVNLVKTLMDPAESGSTIGRSVSITDDGRGGLLVR